MFNNSLTLDTMREIYKMLSEYNELKNVFYTCFFDPIDKSVTIKDAKTFESVCLYHSIEFAISDIKQSLKLIR